MNLPNEVFETLRTMLGKGDRLQWDMGAFLEEVWSEAGSYYTKQWGEKKGRAEYIRDCATNSGADESTLRDRINMRRFFTDADITVWDMYTYHQMRALKSAGPDEWEVFANWGLTAGHDGKLASVKQIRREIKIANQDEVDPEWKVKFDRVKETLAQLTDDIDTPPDVRKKCNDMLEIAYQEMLPDFVDEGEFPTAY